MANTTIQGSYIPWSDLKKFIDDYGLMLHYTENPKKYALRVNNGNHSYKTDLFKAGASVGGDGWDQTQNDIDRADFEANYKANANGLDKTAIHIEQDEEINVTVEANNSGPDCVSPKLRYEAIPTTDLGSSSSYTQVYSYSGSGKFFGFFVELSSSAAAIKLTIDGELVINGLSSSDLPKDAGKSGKGDSVFIWVSSNEKEINCQPPSPVIFATNVKIEIQPSKSNKDLIAGYVVIEKVT